MTVAPGTKFGRYRIERELGRGGDAIVYLADDEVLRRPVALKIFPVTVAIEGSPGATKFRNEVGVLARLDHPGICRIHDAGIESGFPYIAMSYVDGATLDSAARGGERESVALVEGVARSVAAAHAAGIVHGDLKPQNLLVAADGSCVVLDFGVSRLLDGTEGARSGRAAGTLGYLAPERVAGPPDEASDVWALAAVLFELVCGRTPFVAPTHAAFVKKVLLEDPPLCRSLAPRASRDLEAVLARALARRPDRRYATMTAFADDLARLRRGDPVSVARLGPFRRAARWSRRRPAVAALVACVVLFLAASVPVAVIKNRSLGLTLERVRLEAGRSADEARAAEVHLARYVRLADDRRLSDLEARARKLVPPRPELLPELEAWMEEATALASRLPEHAAALEALRRRGRPSPEGRYAADVSPAARREIDELKRRLARFEATARTASDDEAARADRSARALMGFLELRQASAPKNEAWTYDSSGDAWHDATLSALIEDLRTFVDRDPRRGIVRDVELRITEARRFAGEEPAARKAWDDAARSIADRARCPRYDGLVIARQVGLRPLGRNPETGLWEFLHELSGEAPDDAARKLTRPEQGIVLVLVPGGVFREGARRPAPGEAADGPNVDPEANPNESPIDTIRLDPFFISKFELTEAQWVRISGGVPGPDSVPLIWSIDALLPAYSVDWRSATRVLARVGLSLPTEAQWEYAARAGTTTPYWTGPRFDSIAGAEVFGTKDVDPVGRHRPNPWGLYDVLGNLHEWCADVYCTYHSPRLPGTGERWAIEAPDQRIHRGGNFRNTPSHLRSSDRGTDPSLARLNYLGIRAARLVDR